MTTIYWLECIEPGCVYRTRGVATPEDAYRLFPAHEPAHAGKSSETIAHDDSIRCVLVGGTATERSARRSEQTLLFEAD